MIKKYLHNLQILVLDPTFNRIGEHPLLSLFKNISTVLKTTSIYNMSA